MRVGAIDIGTNTVRLLVVDSRAGRLAELAREVKITRLGQDVDSSGLLAPDAIARTVAVLERYGALMDDLGVAARRAVATSASRDASNSAEFLDAAQRAAGVRPEIIGGDVEARLAFRGATVGRDGRGVTLVVDPGGGSTEFVAGTDEPIYAHSVDMGSVRLTERYLGTQPAPVVAIAAARRHVEGLFANELDLPGVDTVIGVAGTFTTLAAMHLELPEYQRAAVHGTTLTRADLGGLADRLAGMTLAEIEAIPSMEPARAPVILGGAIVAETAIAISGRDEVTISESDILDGIALSMLEVT